jgi:transcriptional regulator with XRE-family HTH domain
MTLVSAGKTTMTLPERLRASIERNGTTISAVARELAERNSHQAKSKRRLLQKYLAGTVAPGPKIAQQLEEILNEPDGYFVKPPDPARRRDLQAAWQLLDEIHEIVANLQRRLDAAE